MLTQLVSLAANYDLCQKTKLEMCDFQLPPGESQLGKIRTELIKDDSNRQRERISAPRVAWFPLEKIVKGVRIENS